jgi:phosphoglucosamine mutase
MVHLGGIIGGEEAGHMIFLEHHTTGDGIVTAMQLIAAMVEMGKPLAELSKMMEIYPQKLINVDVSSKPEISSLPKVIEVIKQVESDLRDDGRVLVRYSGTQNMCRVMVEGPTHELTEKYCRQIADVIKKMIG